MNDDKSKLEEYCYQHTSQEPELLLNLIEATYDRAGWPDKLSGRVVGRLLNLLITLHQPKLVVEIGMYTGYSALSMAEALPDDAKIICCETNPRAIEIAKEFYSQAPYGQKIQIEFGYAMDTISKITDKIDFAFIDADKRNYLNYFKALLPKLNPGALIVIDNAIWSGRVLNPKECSDIEVNKLNEFIYHNPSVENVLLSARDGINIVRFKG